MSHGSITDIKGVYASGCACGIKAAGPDLAFIYVPRASACAGVFTRNRFCAPCVEHTRRAITQGCVKVIVANSGNANAATGKQGMQNVKATAAWTAEILGVEPEQVAVASTGIIGKQLPIEKLQKGLTTLLSKPDARDGARTLQAIMTTDTRPKSVYVQEKIGGEIITVAGIAKGSGMIAPNMGTMLAFLATDAEISSVQLQTALQRAVDDSFNMTSVDTDTSTNDMALFLSTGEKFLDGGIPEFTALLTRACQDLAKMIAADGEGATRLIEVRILEAAASDEARRIAKNIADSPLVKTAIHGADPNWGRILAAAGKDPACRLNPENLTLSIQGETVFSQGSPSTECPREKLISLLKQPEIRITMTLREGPFSATAWGCDLTKGYIEINTCYN